MSTIGDISLDVSLDLIECSPEHGSQRPVSSRIANLFRRNTTQNSDRENIRFHENENNTPLDSALIDKVNVSYSPSTNSEVYQRAARRYKIIEESIKSEGDYINALQSLSEVIELFFESSGIRYFPLSNTVYALLKTHRGFLDKIQVPFATTPKTANSAVIDNQLFVTYHSGEAAAFVAKTVAQNCISVYHYQLFLIESDFLLDLVEKSEISTIFNSSYKKFSESVINKHVDCSFFALLNKPSSRLVKYRLLLESLFENMAPKNADTEIVKKSSLMVKEKISSINKSIAFLEKTSQSKYVFQRLCLRDPDIEFPINCLGIPVLCGSLGVCWRETNHKNKLKQMASFLFKSHILLCTISEPSFVIEYLVPLSNCKIIHNEFSEGIYIEPTRSVCSFKLIFEYDYAIYEIVLMSPRNDETDHWIEKLELSINHVNGPYVFDYSASGVDPNQTIVIPNQMSPIDISLNQYNNVGYNFSHCYFGELIIVKIETDQSQNPDLWLNSKERHWQLKQLQPVISAELQAPPSDDEITEVKNVTHRSFLKKIFGKR